MAQPRPTVGAEPPVAERCAQAPTTDQHRDGHLVNGPHGGPVGVLSERDVVLVVGTGGDPEGHQAGEVMSPDIVWAGTRDSVADVARSMCAAGVRHVPLRNEEGAAVGIVSMRDVLSALLDAVR